jgi:hypothetical protein
MRVATGYCSSHVTISSRALLIPILGATFAACGTTAADATDIKLSSEKAPAPIADSARPVYRDVTIPAGTMLPLTLITSLGTDTSVVEDPVSARLTETLMLNGRPVVTEGARFDGTVTSVTESGRVTGYAVITFQFTTVRDGREHYELQVAGVAHQAESARSVDAVKTGAAVVVAPKKEEVRLGPGADVSSRMTAPLTVRVRIS